MLCYLGARGGGCRAALIMCLLGAAVAGMQVACPSTRRIRYARREASPALLYLLNRHPALLPCHACPRVVRPAGRRLLLYGFGGTGRCDLVRRGWLPTRNTMLHLSACPQRSLLAAADGTCTVCLYWLDRSAGGPGDGANRAALVPAFHVVAADTVPRPVTGLVLLPAPAPAPAAAAAAGAEAGEEAAAGDGAEGGMSPEHHHPDQAQAQAAASPSMTQQEQPSRGGGRAGPAAEQGLGLARAPGDGSGGPEASAAAVAAAAADAAEAAVAAVSACIAVTDR